MDLQKVLDQFSKSKLGKSNSSAVHLYSIVKIRPVYEYNLQGQIIGQSSYKELRDQGICLVTNRESFLTEGNRIFSYNPSIPNFSVWLEKRLKQRGKTSKIYKFSPDGTLIKIYDNLSQAEKDGYVRSRIRKCLGTYDKQGNPKKSGGYVWKRENNFCSVK